MLKQLFKVFPPLANIIPQIPRLSTIIGQGYNLPLLPGNIVRCDIGNGIAFHSGVYIGNDKVIELDGNGTVKIVSISEFKDLSYGPIPERLQVATDENGVAYCSTEWSNNAILALESSTEYRCFTNNCHRFTISCIIGRKYRYEHPRKTYSCSDIEFVLKEVCKRTKVIWKIPYTECKMKEQYGPFTHLKGSVC